MGKKRFIFILLLCTLGAGSFIGWNSWNTRRILNQLDRVTKSEDLNSLLQGSNSELADLTEEVRLALREMNLAQGENGQESWRLEASWATIRQESSIIEVRSPRLHYAVGQNTESPSINEEDKLMVTAQKGIVSDGNNKLELTGDVFATQKTNSITGPRLTYDHAVGEMIFTNGAVFQSEDLSGEMDVLRWNLPDNILYGKGNIYMEWYPPAQTANSSADAVGTSPSSSNDGLPADAVINSPSNSAGSVPADAVSNSPSNSAGSVPAGVVINSPSNSTGSVPTDSVATSPSGSTDALPSDAVSNSPSNSAGSVSAGAVSNSVSNSAGSVPADAVSNSPSNSVGSVPDHLSEKSTAVPVSNIEASVPSIPDSGVSASESTEKTEE